MTRKKVVLIVICFVLILSATIYGAVHFLDENPTYESWSDTLKSQVRTFCMKSAVESGFETQFGKPPGPYCECLVDRLEKSGHTKVEDLEKKSDDISYTSFFSSFFASPAGIEAKNECLDP
jgi:hypothetical protein